MKDDKRMKNEDKHSRIQGKDVIILVAPSISSQMKDMITSSPGTYIDETQTLKILHEK